MYPYLTSRELDIFPMGAAPLISIVVPVFNTPADLLDRCVISILDQSYNDIELLLVNDGSDRNTSIQLERLEQSHPNITVLNQANSGVASARNRGIDNAHGDYIAFVDSDDHIAKDFILTALEHILLFNVDAVFGGILVQEHRSSFGLRVASQYGSDQLVLSRHELPPIQAQLLVSEPQTKDTTCVVNAVSALYRTVVAKEIRFRAGLAHAEDRIFNFEILSKCNRVSFTSDIWYYYDRRNENAVTLTRTSRSTYDFLQTISVFSKVAGINPDHAESDSAYLKECAADGIIGYLKLALMSAWVGDSFSVALVKVKVCCRIENLDTIWSKYVHKTFSDRILYFFLRRNFAVPLLIFSNFRYKLSKIKRMI